MIYADNAATTAISQEVLKVMMPYLTTNYGNASSLYSFGMKNKTAIEKAREQVAKAINAKSNEIYFTSGATESNNWVLNNFDIILTSSFEHPSIYNVLENQPLSISQKDFFETFYVLPNSDGIVTLESIQKAIKFEVQRWFETPELISIMAVNNEIGTIQPIKQIGQLCREKGILFHTDATQAIGHIPIDVKEMNIDMLSLSGHKFHAPKGIGVLYIREGVYIKPFMHGGHQENGLRAGTENVASIVGIGKAIEIATRNLYKQSNLNKKKMRLLELISEIGGIEVNGSLEKRIAGNLNIFIKDCDAESLVLRLDINGICVSTGSACSTGTLEPSRTLKSMGLSDEQAFSSIRISLDENITDNEISEMAEIIKREITKLRGKNEDTMLRSIN